MCFIRKDHVIEEAASMCIAFQHLIGKKKKDAYDNFESFMVKLVVPCHDRDDALVLQ